MMSKVLHRAARDCRWWMAPDGQLQVTYGGHPLYRYAGDAQPGQTNGQGLNEFGAEWYAVSASGDVVDHG